MEEGLGSSIQNVLSRKHGFGICLSWEEGFGFRVGEFPVAEALFCHGAYYSIVVPFLGLLWDIFRWIVTVIGAFSKV